MGLSREDIEALPLCELDGLVAALEGIQVVGIYAGQCKIVDTHADQIIVYSPTNDTSLAVDFIEREKIALVWLDNEWRAFTKNGNAYKVSAYLQNSYIDVADDIDYDGRGQTMLIAAMRAYVLSKQE